MNGSGQPEQVGATATSSGSDTLSLARSRGGVEQAVRRLSGILDDKIGVAGVGLTLRDRLRPLAGEWRRSGV